MVILSGVSKIDVKGGGAGRLERAYLEFSRLQKRGKWEKAAQLGPSVLDLFSSVFGRDHKKVSGFRSTLARVLLR